MSATTVSAVHSLLFSHRRIATGHNVAWTHMLASLLHCLLDILRVEIFASDNDDVLDPASYVQPSKGLGMVSLPDALEARDVLMQIHRNVFFCLQQGRAVAIFFSISI